MSLNASQSVYPVSGDEAAEIESILAVIVDNEPGVLGRVVGLFSARGYNIESLTVAEVDADKHYSRITIVTHGTPQKIDQIKSQLGRLVPVRRVIDVSKESDALERELALVKVEGEGDNRVEAMRMADIFRARALDITHSSFVFEITGLNPRFLFWFPESPRQVQDKCIHRPHAPAGIKGSLAHRRVVDPARK